MQTEIETQEFDFVQLKKQADSMRIFEYRDEGRKWNAVVMPYFRKTVYYENEPPLFPPNFRGSGMAFMHVLNPADPSDTLEQFKERWISAKLGLTLKN